MNTLPGFAVRPPDNTAYFARIAARNVYLTAQHRAERKHIILAALHIGPLKFASIRALTGLAHMSEQYVRDLLTEMQAEGSIVRGCYGYWGVA